MKRVAVAIVALVLLGSAGVAAALSAGSFRAVYSVAEVRAGLARNPRAWIGQTVLIRGVVLGGGFAIKWLPVPSSPPPVPWARPPTAPLLRFRAVPLVHVPAGGISFAGAVRVVQLMIASPVAGGVLVDATTQPAAFGLPLAFAPQDPALSFLRRLPWIGRFAPAPQSLSAQWDKPAVYRVRIQAAPAGSCGRGPCYEALLLDSAQSPWLPIASMRPAPAIMLRLPVPILHLPAPGTLLRFRPSPQLLRLPVPMRIMRLHSLTRPLHVGSAAQQAAP